MLFVKKTLPLPSKSNKYGSNIRPDKALYLRRLSDMD